MYKRVEESSKAGDSSAAVDYYSPGPGFSPQTTADYLPSPDPTLKGEGSGEGPGRPTPTPKGEKWSGLP